MAKKKEESVSKEAGRDRLAHERMEADREAYRRYWLTLSPRDRERMPEP